MENAFLSQRPLDLNASPLPHPKEWVVLRQGNVIPFKDAKQKSEVWDAVMKYGWFKKK